MNGKPQALRELTSGLAIGAGQNEGFVDTFNWLVRFCDNLKGDNTFITLENEFGDHPRIVFDQTKLFGLGGGGSDYTPYPQPFDFDKTNNKIVYCVFYAGRDMYQMPDYTIVTTGSGYNGGTYWLKIVTDQSGDIDMNSTGTGIEMTPSKVLPSNNTTVPRPTNTDYYTYYPIWTFDYDGTNLTPIFDWRPTWKAPFYSAT